MRRLVIVAVLLVLLPPIAVAQRDPSIQLYADGLHPSIEGAYLASLVVYGRLLGKATKGLPAPLRLRSGATISVSVANAAMLQAAADSALATMP